VSRSLPLIEVDAPAPRPDAQRPARPLRVALVNVPWARTDAPSIQFGLLQAIVRLDGHECRTHYLNLDLAMTLGRSVYDALSGVNSERLHLLGEWLFAHAAFGEVTGEQEYYAEFPEVEPLWAKLTGQDLTGLTAIRR
jgi:hypothetical protein